jgi:hypothetical protein
MDWERISNNWQHYKRYAQVRWAKLSDQDLELIAGSRETLVMQLSALYGISADAAQMQLESWQGRLGLMAPPL